MDLYTGTSIIVSIIAVIVSVVSYKTNKAVNNQIQLQNNYFDLCQKLQKLINFGTEDNLTSFKFDIENYTCYDKSSIDSCREFNNLKKRFYEQKMQVKSAYMEMKENFDFLYTQTRLLCFSNENQFDVWLNDNIDIYFSKLDKYYDDLDRIFKLTRGAQLGLQSSDENQIVDAFYDNIIDIIRISQALQLLKRNMAGRFKRLSVREINAFNDNEILISNIKKEMYSYVIQFGIDDAIKNTDFSKIKQVCSDFGVHYDEFINEEKNDYHNFLRIIRKNSNKSKWDLGGRSWSTIDLAVIVTPIFSNYWTDGNYRM